MRRVLYRTESLTLVVGLLIFGSVAVAPAMADTITYNFTGEVDHVGRRLGQPAPPHNISTSSSMSGVMTVKTDDLNSSGNQGRYEIESFKVTIGGYTATYPPGTLGEVRIRNGNAINGDQFRVLVDDPTGSQLNGLSPSLFRMTLTGPNTVFSSDDLPGPGDLPASISDFSRATTWRLLFAGPGGAGTRTISGDMESLTAVPLPAGVVLFGLGLVALIGFGSGGLRNLRLPQA